MLAETTPEMPYATVNIDLNFARQQNNLSAQCGGVVNRIIPADSSGAIEGEACADPEYGRLPSINASDQEKARLIRGGL